MSRQSKNAVKKFIKKQMTDKMLTEIILGVVEDFRSKKYPDDTPCGVWTLGEILEAGDFETNYEMMHEIVGTAIGRTVRNYCLMTDPSLLMSPSIVKLIMTTDEQQDRLAAKLVKMFSEMNPNPNVNEEHVKLLLEKREQFVNEAFNQS
jgi:hypothetical protein